MGLLETLKFPKRVLLAHLVTTQKELKMAIQDTLDRLAAIDGKIDKVGAEIRAEVQGLRDQIAALTVTPEQQAALEASLASIESKLQGLDDLNADAPAA